MPETLTVSAIPHRSPFLFVDEIVEVSADRIVTCFSVDPDAEFFKGHYPGNPVMPGVLLCECCFQAGALLIAHRLGADAAARGTPVVTRITDARFRRIVRPGDRVTIETILDDELDNAFYLTARVRVDDKSVLRVTFACMLANKEAVS